MAPLIECSTYNTWNKKLGTVKIQNRTLNLTSAFILGLEIILQLQAGRKYLEE